MEEKPGTSSKFWGNRIYNLFNVSGTHNPSLRRWISTTDGFTSLRDIASGRLNVGPFNSGSSLRSRGMSITVLLVLVFFLLHGPNRMMNVAIVLGDESSPLFLPIPGFSTADKDAMADKEGLLAFKEAMGNHPAFEHGAWANISLHMTYESTKPCVQFWAWIVCDGFGRVSGIEMDNPQLAAKNSSWAKTNGNGGFPLRGTIPWDKMTGLSRLNYINLQGNAIYGPAFTPAISKFTALQRINLQGNLVSGSIPDEITVLKSLTDFDVSINKMTGPIPKGISALQNMTKFAITSNSFTGVLLDEIGNMTNLGKLDIGANNFYGQAPETWGQLSKLTLLNLQRLQVNGTLPESWSGMKSILKIYAPSAKITGTYPKFLSNSTTIASINLAGNRLYGELPKTLWSPKNLTELDISNNLFNGTLPGIPSDRAAFASFSYFGNCLTLTPTQAAGITQASNRTCTNFYKSFYPSPPPPPSPPAPTYYIASPPSKSSSNLVIIISIAIPAAFILLGLGVYAYFYYNGRNRRLSRLFTKGLKQSSKEFSLSELKGATQNWSTVIGKGGYGTVYKAVLKDGTAVAVKRLDQVSKQGDVEFIREVELLSRVHHRHLVNLLGFCAEKGERALIYEYMAMGSLYEHLHGESAKEYPLSWDSRAKIAIHVALGIEYLHYGADPPLIHRDIKSANILLSDDGYSKVADFGLCKEAPIGAGTDGSEQLVPTATAVRGSFGYLDPEYVNTSILSEKSDVYSYGVVLLELITGHKSIHEWQPLAYWAEEYLVDREKTPLMVDPALEGHFDLDELYALCDIARTCVHDQSVNRPTIRDVAKSLVENLGQAMTSSYASSHRDTASMVSSSQSDASSMPSTSISTPSSEFSYQNYSETLHWTPDQSGKVSGSQSGGASVSTGTKGDHLPVPVPRRPNDDPGNAGGGIA